MSALVHCRDCGWEARYRRAAAAHRAVTRHRCPHPDDHATRQARTREAQHVH